MGYLDNDGLAYFWGKAKEKLSSQTAETSSDILVVYADFTEAEWSHTYAEIKSAFDLGKVVFLDWTDIGNDELSNDYNVRLPLITKTDDSLIFAITHFKNGNPVLLQVALSNAGQTITQETKLGSSDSGSSDSGSSDSGSSDSGSSGSGDSGSSSGNYKYTNIISLAMDVNGDDYYGCGYVVGMTIDELTGEENATNDNYAATGFFDCTATDVLRLTSTVDTLSDETYAVIYDEEYTFVKVIYTVMLENNVYTLDLADVGMDYLAVRFVAVSDTSITGSGLVVTHNEEI